MNHFLPSSDTLWYTPTSMDQHHQKSLPFFYHSSLSLSSSFKYDDVDSDNSSSNNNPTTATTTATTAAIDRSETTSSPSSLDHEYMFEKPLTPSDVGKLNRLVIPKQHAEKYFPLAAADSAATAGDKSGNAAVVGGGGVLLGFEDESGKCWKFRYSYWNSSQSYVLTKGWSRYVKEKKLDAGDVVLFQRHRFESDRFFIGWRRRGSTPVYNPAHPSPVHYNNNNNNNNTIPQNYGVLQSQRYNGGPHSLQISSFPSYRPECLHAGGEVRQEGRKTVGGNAKRVRLFGVNLECERGEEEEEEPQTSDGSSLSSQGGGQGQYQGGSGSGFAVGPSTYNYFDYVGYPPNHYNSHMDMNFPQDVNQTRRLR